MNLALVLKDGQKITIPVENNQGTIGIASTPAGLMDINTASLVQLMDLPGIGEQKAQAILSYRDEHGSFQKIEDLMEVPGVGESIFEEVKKLITVNP